MADSHPLRRSIRLPHRPLPAAGEGYRSGRPCGWAPPGAAAPASGAVETVRGRVTLRAAGPADAPAAREMHRRCSAATLTRRYPGPADEADRYLGHLLDARHGHSLAAVAPDGSLVGLGHLLRDGDEAEVALLVEDAWQRHGVGTAVLRELVGLAVREGREAVYAVTDTANTAMIATMRATGLPLEQWPEEHGTLVLSASLAVPHGLSPARLRG